jgi:predicted transcriptional regulator YdeE
MNMKKIIIIATSLLLVSGVVAYIALGGLKKPEITTQTVSDYMMAGVEFKGLASSEVLLQLFEQTRTYHEQNKLPGTLAAVYYDNQSEKGEVEAFVGVLVTDTLTALPDTYVYKKIPANKTVQAKIMSHYMVAPSPEKIRGSLLNYAQEKGLALQELVIEQYLKDSHILIEIPVKVR